MYGNLMLRTAFLRWCNSGLMMNKKCGISSNGSISDSSRIAEEEIVRRKSKGKYTFIILVVDSGIVGAALKSNGCKWQRIVSYIIISSNKSNV